MGSKSGIHAPDDPLVSALRDGAVRVSVPLGAYRTLSERLDIADRVLPWHVLWMVTASCCEAVVEGERWRLEPGSVIWLPAGTRNSMHAVAGAVPATLYHLRATFEPAIRLGPSCRPLLGTNRWDLRPLFDMLHSLYQAPAAWWQERMVSALLLLRAGLLEDRQEPDTTGLSAAQKDTLLWYVRNHLSDNPRPADLAKELGLNPDYFSRLFKRTFGQSARTWLVAQRVKAAADYVIDTRMGITEIAYAFGYQDVFLFSRQFKKVMGMSPTEYRTRTGNESG